MVTFSMPPEHSGAAKQAITLATHLAKAGISVFFVTMRSTPESIGVDEVAGFRVVRIVKQTLAQKAVAPLRVFAALVRERHNFDVLHVHGVGYLSSVAVLFGRLFAKPVLVKMTMYSEDDALSVRRRRFGIVTFAFFSRSTRLIAITERFRRSCEEAGIPPGCVALIPNGVDTRRFCPASSASRRDLRQALGLPANATLLAYAGIVRPDKGIHVLLDTMDVIAKRRRDIALVLLGPMESWLPSHERSYAAAMRDRMTCGTLRDVVHFRAGVPNVHEYFRASDLFVAASSREGFPNVLLEAMASGLAPVVVDIPHVYSTILDATVDSVVVGEPDPVLMAERLLELVDDPPRRARMANAALEKVLARYSMDRVAGEYNALYRLLTAFSP